MEDIIEKFWEHRLVRKFFRNKAFKVLFCLLFLFICCGIKLTEDAFVKLMGYPIVLVMLILHFLGETFRSRKYKSFVY